MQPNLWHCFNCNTTLNTRRRARIEAHKKICERKKRNIVKNTELDSITPSLKKHRRSSVDVCNEGIATPSVFEWSDCPICGSHIRNARLIEDHFVRHLRNRTEQTQTPAEFLAECNESVQGTSNGSNSSDQCLYRLTRPISKVENVRLRSTEDRLSFTLSDQALQLSRDGHLLSVMYTIIRDVVDKHQRNPHSLLRIVFDSDSMEYAFSGVFCRADEFDIYGYLDQLERILNSKQSIQSDENIELYVQSIANPASGSGRSTLKRKDYSNMRQFFRMRHCIFYINNDDHKCFLSLAAGLTFFKKTPALERKGRNDKRMTRENKSMWKRTPHKNKHLKKIADLLISLVQHPSDTPVTPSVFPRIQCVLNEKYSLQLVIFNSDENDDVIFAGTPERIDKKRIYHAFGDNHFCYIKNYRKYLNQHYLCNLCYKVYWSFHKCKLKCDRCDTKICFETRNELGVLSDIVAFVKCPDCGFLFYSNECMAEHRKKRICKNYTACNLCERKYNKKRPHRSN